MSGYKNFAIVGNGMTGNFIVRQLLKYKATGTVNEVVVLTREGFNATVDDDAKAIPVDHSNKQSIKDALATCSVDVVIYTVSSSCLGLQTRIAEAAKDAGVKLFVPSEFGGSSEGRTTIFDAKASIRSQLRALGLPYAAFYTGLYADWIWTPLLILDVTSGKVSVGGDGDTQISFTSRPDIARYVSYVLTHLPVEKLENHSFRIGGDVKSFNEIFRAYEAKTGKKLEVTYIPVSELEARLASNPHDFFAFLHKMLATTGPVSKSDNHLYPDWNPSSVLDNIPVA